MTRTENCSNQQSFSQSVFKDKVNGFLNKLNTIFSSVGQTNYSSSSMTNFILITLKYIKLYA